MMLRINRQTDYAVRVILILARQPEGKKLSTAFIRDEMVIPRAFVQRIVARLAAHKLVTTFPGRDGGLMLSRPAKQITLLDVVEAFEGRLCISDCFDDGSTDCPFEAGCPVRDRWQRLQSVMTRELAGMNFADLSKQETNPRQRISSKG
jgi:Rrf2 family protein